MHRTHNIAFVEAVVNHHSVRPTAARGTHWLTATELVGNPDNYVFTDGGGIYAFVRLPGAVYEGHVFAPEGHRGSQVIKLGKAAIGALFGFTDAVRLVVAVPLYLPAARLLCRKLGLLAQGRDLFNEYFEVESGAWAVS